MATARDLLQDIRNNVSTAENGWLAWAEACTQAYDSAYQLHTNALAQVKETLRLQAEVMWQLLGIVLGSFGAAWVPRLLAPVVGGTDTLLSAWINDALVEATTDVVANLKDTAIDKLRQAGGRTNDPYQPAVATSLTYSSRLKEGIYKRAALLESGLDQVVASADRWNLQTATFLKTSFTKYCPFLTNVPADGGDTFKEKFQKEAELAMWIKWTLGLDEKEWASGKSVGEREATNPIADRLVALGVPWSEISAPAGAYSLYYNPRVPIFSVWKLIKWAKNQDKHPASQQVCRKVDPMFLKIRRRPSNVCSVGDDDN